MAEPQNAAEQWVCKPLHENAGISGYVILRPVHHRSGVNLSRIDDRGVFAEADARLIAAAPQLLAAVDRQIANIAHWLETGDAAGPDESREIYEQLKAAADAAVGAR